MLDRTKQFILMDVSNYLREATALYSGLQVTPHLHPIAHQLLGSSFMQMIGCLEQKLHQIKWYLGFQNIHVRYKLQKDFLRQSTGVEVLNSAYKLLLEEIKILDSGAVKFSQNLWENDVYLIQAHNDIVDLFEHSSLTNYTNADFNDFKNDKLIRGLKNAENIHNRIVTILKSPKRSTDCKQRLDKFLKEFAGEYKERGSLLADIYDQVMLHRHTIAHNLLSVRADFPGIKIMSGKYYKYESYYFRFLIVVYLDLVFKSLFSSYLKAHKKKVVFEE